MHLDAIARWFARLRKTTVQKVYLDLTITPPCKAPEDLYYRISGKCTRAYAVVLITPKTRRPDWHTNIMHSFPNFAFPVEGGLARCWVNNANLPHYAVTGPSYYLLIEMPNSDGANHA